jgi:hypothetical protein
MCGFSRLTADDEIDMPKKDTYSEKEVVCGDKATVFFARSKSRAQHKFHGRLDQTRPSPFTDP